MKTLIGKPDPEYGAAAPQPCAMIPEAFLRALPRIAIGAIVLETTERQDLALRRVTRP